MEQFEQLLTCAICLDRYRNPKLLPCQHSFCMEPCMDGLVDYVRRQVKCPECRAEHRIPYQGVQGYPTNVTLQRFLELHIEITGELPDPTSGQVMKRCGVCSEKAYCTTCGHCEKEICADCKGAHMDILRREIARINNQVRRALHRLQDMLAMVEKNMLALQTNCTSVTEEVDEIYRRLAKALKDRTEYLHGEVDRYLGTELRNLSTLKDNLELEISNIDANCDLADKHMQSEAIEWDDCELMDAKDIFLKTVEFIRNFETETNDYTRRARFVMAHEPNQLVLHVAGYGELSFNMPHQSLGPAMLQPPGPGLMRSKSDHRLASQYRQEQGYERPCFEGGEGGQVSPLGGRKFGDRPVRTMAVGDRYEGRYGRGERGDYGELEGYEDARQSARSRIRSRLRHGQGTDADSDNDQPNRSVRFSEITHKERERVLDTEDVSKGPLSGITRLYDSPRVMRRLQESGNKKEVPEPIVPPAAPAPKALQPAKRAGATAQRQVSEEDEISKIKKLNKNAPGEPQSTASLSQERERPGAERVAALRGRIPEGEREGSGARGEQPPSPTSTRSTPSSDSARKTPVPEAVSSEESEEESVGTLQQRSRKSSTSVTPTSKAAPVTLQGSRRSSASSDIAASTAPIPGTRTSSVGSGAGTVAEKVLPVVTAKKDEDEEEEDETETSSESEESDSEEEEKPPVAKMEKTDIGPLLARSQNARDSGTTRRPSRDETYSRYGDSSYRSPYAGDTETPAQSGGGYLSRSRMGEEEPLPQATPTPATGSRYGTKPAFQSRFLNKSKSTAAVSPEEEEPQRRYSNAGIGGSGANSAVEERYPSGRTRYSALKDRGAAADRSAANDRKARIPRSKSTHNFGGDEDEEEEASTTTSPSAYIASKYGNDLSRSRSTHALKSRESSPERPTSTTAAGGGGAEKDGAALSSWARYLKNKYGNRGKEKPTTEASAASTTSRRLSLGLPLRSNAATTDNSDEESKNTPGSPIYPTPATAPPAGFAAVGSSTRNQYLAKRRQLFHVGSRGSEPGCFTWPRGIAVGPDNSIVVADSSNHRVQVFDSNGIFLKEFGCYGNGEGEFDCLAGVAVNRIGQFIIADRYNHRIQVFDPSGRFLRAFGSQGAADGRFNYPWGITTDALGFIYVCDKENHRVQVFQSDGTFVGKFGSHGNKVGQLEHPHYIAVSNTNRVIVSDSNNHRIQMFDVNGRVLSSFGTEGSDEGQFKFPRGVAVDDQGYILVGDSGNNRIVILSPEGVFVRAFGCWGSGDGEFKGLEGVAVMSNANILVCDRENHRVQVF